MTVAWLVAELLMVECVECLLVELHVNLHVICVRFSGEFARILAFMASILMWLFFTCHF